MGGRASRGRSRAANAVAGIVPEAPKYAVRGRRGLASLGECDQSVCFALPSTVRLKRHPHAGWFRKVTPHLLCEAGVQTGRSEPYPHADSARCDGEAFARGNSEGIVAFPLWLVGGWSAQERSSPPRPAPTPFQQLSAFPREPIMACHVLRLWNDETARKDRRYR